MQIKLSKGVNNHPSTSKRCKDANKNPLSDQNKDISIIQFIPGTNYRIIAWELGFRLQKFNRKTRISQKELNNNQQTSNVHLTWEDRLKIENFIKNLKFSVGKLPTNQIEWNSKIEDLSNRIVTIEELANYISL
jgi:hypothetical protein